MRTVGTLEEWIAGFELELQRRFNRKLYLMPVDRDGTRRLDVNGIARIVAGVAGVSVEDLRAPGRREPMANARQIAMYLTVKHTGITLTEIGRYYSRRDHTTVGHSVKVVLDRVKVCDARTVALLDEAEKMIKNIYHEEGIAT
ncbi:MAG: hypothetical protein M9959_01990 [Chitinophagaceae bacterium]|jgi:chromosomal replication initiation ATPase DnaA|nr:hypothetical protein [Chitinophagaceae bacterium]